MFTFEVNWSTMSTFVVILNIDTNSRNVYFFQIIMENKMLMEL
jgi:hypothetical protein